VAEWIDLLDPSDDEIRGALPRAVHETALDLLLAPSRHDDEPRPRLEGHDHYVFGVFLIPIAVREEDRIYYQELDLVATRERVLTVRKTPERGDACDLGPVRDFLSEEPGERGSTSSKKASTTRRRSRCGGGSQTSATISYTCAARSRRPGTRFDA
jgi:hypothetical protein